MTRKKTSLVIVGAAAALLLVGTAITITIRSGPNRGQSDDSSSPLGGLFQRAARVSQLKEQMQSMRSVYPAIVSYAQAHQDELPNTLVELRPYLPANLAGLDDEHWEMPSKGKATPLLNGADAKDGILLQQKSVQPGKARIVVFADGHMEYKP